MPTAQGRSGTLGRLCVLFDAAGCRPVPLSHKRYNLSANGHRLQNFPESLQGASTSRSSSIHLISPAAHKLRLSSTSTQLYRSGTNGQEDSSSLEKSSHSMGRCHVFIIFLFLCFFSVSIIRPHLVFLSLCF